MTNADKQAMLQEIINVLDNMVIGDNMTPTQLAGAISEALYARYLQL